MLCYRASLASHNVFYWSELQKTANKPKVCNIQDAKDQMGPELCKNIPFLHAVLGCDTSSQLYRIGKGASRKKFKTSWHFQCKPQCLIQSQLPPKKLLEHEKLDSLHYKRFFDKVSTSIYFVSPQALPPTTAGTKYHCLKVYIQIMEWEACTNKVSPLDWGVEEMWWKTNACAYEHATSSR